jgi:hypothetical protein
MPQKQAHDSCHFCHIKLLFQLINVKNGSNKVDYQLKSFVNSNLIAIFAAILQNQVHNDTKNRI